MVKYYDRDSIHIRSGEFYVAIGRVYLAEFEGGKLVLKSHRGEEAIYNPHEDLVKALVRIPEPVNSAKFILECLGKSCDEN